MCSITLIVLSTTKYLPSFVGPVKLHQPSWKG